MNNKRKAFSLIELMVVITIVGLLAAIAVPSYQQYIFRSKISSAVQIVDGLKDKVLSYYGSNGTFPADPAAIGIPDGYNPIVSGLEFPPYLAGYGLSSVAAGTDGPTSCAYGVSQSTITNYDGNFLTNELTGKYIVYYEYYYEVNGAMEMQCTYVENSSSGMAADPGLIPNCIYNNNDAIEEYLLSSC